MSSYPSSTCATDGSNTSCPRHIGTTSSTDHLPPSTSITNTLTSNEAAKVDEEAARLISYLNNTVEANPTYQHTSSATSMATHSAQMRSYLDSFDDIMEEKK